MIYTELVIAVSAEQVFIQNPSLNLAGDNIDHACLYENLYARVLYITRKGHKGKGFEKKPGKSLVFCQTPLGTPTPTFLREKIYPLYF